MKQTHDEFARSLRDDAAREKAEFSDALHTRVMAGVRCARVRSEEAGPSWRWVFVAIGGGVTAALAVLVWMNAPSNPPPVQRLALPTIPPLDRVIREKAAPVREELEKARFAYLDRDGKRLARFLWHSVPGVARERKDDGSSL